jgi:hypothetical protein
MSLIRNQSQTVRCCRTMQQRRNMPWNQLQQVASRRCASNGGRRAGSVRTENHREQLDAGARLVARLVHASRRSNGARRGSGFGDKQKTGNKSRTSARHKTKKANETRVRERERERERRRFEPDDSCRRRVKPVESW